MSGVPAPSKVAAERVAIAGAAGLAVLKLATGLATVWVDAAGDGQGQGEATVAVRDLEELHALWSRGRG